MDVQQNRPSENSVIPTYVVDTHPIIITRNQAQYANKCENGYYKNVIVGQVYSQQHDKTQIALKNVGQAA